MTKQFNNANFKRLREFLKLNQTEFAIQVNSSQQVIAMIENNKRGVPASIREQFYKTYQVSYDEAILCNTEKELHRLITTKQGIAHCYNDSISNTRDYFDTHLFICVPFYAAKAAAGEGIDIPDYLEKDVMYFDKRWLQNVLNVSTKNLSLITAEGDSMFPLINNGDLLLVDSSSIEPMNNKVYVIEDEGKLRVKRIKKEFNGDIYLISDNSKFEPELVEHDIKVIGRVVWNGTKEFV